MSASAIKAGEAYIELTAQDSKLQGGLNRARVALKAFGKTATKAGTSMLAAFTAVATPAGFMTKIFSDFDDQMRMAQAVTSSTTEELKAMTEQAKELGRTTSYTAAQVAAGMVSLGRMGFSPDEISHAIEPVMYLAKVTGTELAEAADIAANTLRIFNKDAKEMTYVTDLLSVTANGSAQTLTDLYEALSEGGRPAYEAGESIRDTAAAFGIMANMSIKGSRAGTALRNAYLRMADPAVREYMEGLNIDVLDSSRNIRKMADILLDLGKAMHGMGTGDKLDVLNKVFGLRAITPMTGLTTNIQAMEEFIKKLDESAGQAEANYKKMEAGIGGTIRRILSELEGLAIAFGESIAPFITEFVNAMSPLLAAWTEFVRWNPKLIRQLAQLAVNWGAAGAAVYSVGKISSWTSAGIGMLQKTLKFLGTAGALAHAQLAKIPAALAAMKSSMVSAGGVSGMFALALGRLKVAIHGVNASLMALAHNPYALAIGASVAAIAAAVGIFYRQAQKTAQAAKQAAQDAEEAYNRASTITQRHEQARNIAQENFSSLAKLAKASETARLSADEIETAVELINSLDPFGSASWASIDAVTGKIKLAADAAAQLQKSFQQQAIGDREREFHKLEQQEKAVRAQMAKYAGWRDWISPSLPFIDSSVEKNAPLVQQIDEIMKKKLEAYRRLQQAMRGEDPGIFGQGRQTAEAKAEEALRHRLISLEKFQTAEKSVAEYEKQIADARKSALEKEIENIEEAKKKYLEALAVMLEYERNKPADRQDQDKIRQWTEKQNAAGKQAEDLKQAAREKESDNARQALRHLADELEDTSDTYARRRKQEEEDRKLDRFAENNPVQAMEHLQTLMDQATSSAAAAKAEALQLIRTAGEKDEDGVVRYTDKEKKDIKKALDNYDQQEKRVDNYRGRLEDVQQILAKSENKIVSGFDASAVARMFGAAHKDSNAERTAAATERSERHLRKIETQLGRAAWSAIQ